MGDEIEKETPTPVIAVSAKEPPKSKAKARKPSKRLRVEGKKVAVKAERLQQPKTDGRLFVRGLMPGAPFHFCTLGGIEFTAEPRVISLADFVDRKGNKVGATERIEAAAARKVVQLVPVNDAGETRTVVTNVNSIDYLPREGDRHVGECVYLYEIEDEADAKYVALEPDAMIA